MLNLTGVLGWMQVAPNYVPPIDPTALGALLFNAGVRPELCLNPEMREGWLTAEADRLAEFAATMPGAPADLIGGAFDVECGASYGFGDWAAVERDVIGD